MKKRNHLTAWQNWWWFTLLIGLLLAVGLLSGSTIGADNPSPTPTPVGGEALPWNTMSRAQDPLPPDGEYYRVRTVTLEDGTSIDEIVINGPPTPPPGYERPVAKIPDPGGKLLAINILSNVPAFNWSFGCSATSGAMIAGYYDRTGYGNMYAGPTNGGVMPLDNSSWPDVVISGETRHQCPLSATRDGVDGRTIRGHVDDYWIAYGSTAPDPFITNGWPEHTYGDCTGDYMKTNQSDYGNTDGSTAFWNYTNGAPLHWYNMNAAARANDGGYGLKLFYESRGYTVSDMYNQYILGYASPTLGFTYDQYKAEIDAGRPVMIHLEGHTMVGLGYDDATNLMYIHDTWDYSAHTMTWGGSYSGMDHVGVTIVQLASTPPDPKQACDLAISPPTPQVDETVMFSFCVRNDGSESITFQNIGPQGHGPPDGQGGLWNVFAHDITVGAGQTVNVSASRSFEWEGTWCIEHVPTQDQDGNWHDLPANGYMQAQCFDVSSSPSPADLRQASDLQVSPAYPVVDQEVTFSYAVKNYGGESITIDTIIPQGHAYDDGQQTGLWNVPSHNITVGPGETVNINAHRSFEWEATWCIEHIPVLDQNGVWFDLPANGYMQAQCFDVSSSPSPADLRQASDLQVSPAYPVVDQEVTFSYAVKNYGGESITIDTIIPQGHAYDDGQQTGLWNVPSHNITVGPGETVNINAHRSFEWEATWCIEHIPVLDQNGVWFDLPANGYMQAQCFNVGPVIPQAEYEALVALYNSTDGANWSNNSGWLDTNTPCNWYGVTCSAGHVISLYMYNNQLSGSIPPQLGNLTHLQYLSLWWNQLSGNIPAELGNLTNLQSINLSVNQLSASIPPQLGSLANLQHLDLHGNQLSGSIPQN